MEYWIPWGGSEVFFEAPEEATVITPLTTRMTEAEIASKLSKLSSTALLIIDYLPPAKAYEPLLSSVASISPKIYVTSWRLGEDIAEDAVGELRGLAGNLEIEPLGNLHQLDAYSGEVTFVYPSTTRVLLEGFADSPRDILGWLLRFHGHRDLDVSGLSVKALELLFTPDGNIQAVWAEGETPTSQRLDPHSILVSPGKAPLDSHFYNLAQAIIVAASTCNDETTILAVAECKQGLGPPEFVKNLHQYIKLGETEKPGLNSSPSEIIAYRLSEILKNAKTYLATPLPRSLVQAIVGSKAFETVQEGVSHLIRLHGRGQKILVIRDGLHRVPNIGLHPP